MLSEFFVACKKSRWREIRTKTLPSRGCFRESAAAGEIRDIQKYISRTYPTFANDRAPHASTILFFREKKCASQRSIPAVISERAFICDKETKTKRRREITEETLEAA